MSAIEQSSESGHHLQPRARIWKLPRLALRRRASSHPMVMFFLVVFSAFAAMTLVPPSGAAFASLGVSDLVKPAGEGTTPKTARLRLSEADIACQGQPWGAESQGCLDQIAKESGLGKGHPIRMIASAEPETDTPNVF